jgi:hypothetical protein
MWCDYIRSFKDRPFWITETSPNWNGSEFANYSRPKNWILANIMFSVIQGAELNAYWLWRSHLGGHELMHGSVIDSYGRPSHNIEEISKLGSDMDKLSPYLCETNIQKNDIAEVSHIVHVKETNKTTIKVRVNNKIDGFIQIDENPYHNGNFSFVEKINVNGAEVTTLKFESTFIISEETIIKDLPSNNAKNLHEISHKEGGEYFKSIAITSDYQWVKMVVGEISGWVPARTLSRDIGGPTIYTPEKSIYWDLIGSNLI